jgi:DNA-binding HxlR family transcriptional regulator
LKYSHHRSTCAIAVSIDFLGDKWSLLVLRDMLLHRKTTVKEFLNSKEKIASNVLASRLANLANDGLIYKLNPRGTKKSAIYLATPKGISSLKVIIELYLFSIGDLLETQLDESQLSIKAAVLKNKDLFIQSRQKLYSEFVSQIQVGMIENQEPNSV